MSLGSLGREAFSTAALWVPRPAVDKGKQKERHGQTVFFDSFFGRFLGEN